MSALKSDLQKLENLLKSATSERQRKMYQSLLDKALKDTSNQKIVSVQKAETETPNAIATSTKQKQKKRSTKKVNEEVKVTELKTTTKAKRETETSEPKTTKTEDSPKLPVKQPANSAPQKNQAKKGNQQSQKIGQDVFQAVGWISCLTKIEDDNLYIVVDSQQYLLKRGQWKMGKNFDNLKLEIEQHGSQQKCLQVYPKVVHNLAEEKIDYWFSLVKAVSETSLRENQQKDFVLRGIWQKVPHCSEPVISVYRNIDMLHHYKRISKPAAKKAFARPQDFPVVWNAPGKPFRYNPTLADNEQMPLYFVQVRAVFKDCKFKVTEEIEEPTLDIPRFIKPPKKSKN